MMVVFFKNTSADLLRLNFPREIAAVVAVQYILTVDGLRPVFSIRQLKAL